MLERLLRGLSRHKRAISIALLFAIIIASGYGLGLYPGGNGPGGPGFNSGGGMPEVVKTITAPCKQDPAHVPTGGGEYLHTCGSQIYDRSGNLVKITGVSWFGFETSAMAPDGLYARNWGTILDQLVALHYNLIRIPYSNDILRPGAMPSNINYLLNPDLKGLTSLQILDKVIEGCRQRGLRVLLDRHRPTSAGQSDLWYTSKVSEQQWIDDWVFLAKRYQGNDTVIGADLQNEPRGAATWGTGDLKTDWHLAAERAGDAILEVNPYWLIFVQGIEHVGNDWYWWGGNLSQVGKYPVVLNVPNRVVYSPHDYGPQVYEQGWFKVPSFPNNLPSVWDEHWGYIAEQGIAPVVLGEFGGKSVGKDAEGQWQRALVTYLGQHDFSFISWALNPTSGDTGGILQSDWLSVDSSKQSLYSPGLAGPLPNSGGAGSGPPVTLSYHDSGTSPNSASFTVTMVNGRGTPLELSDVTIRYWIAGDPKQTQAAIDWALLGNGKVSAKVVPSACGTQRGYIELSFTNGTLAGYDTTGPILVRYHRKDWTIFAASRDYGYNNSSAEINWSHIQVYEKGQLIAGNALPC